MTTKPSYLGLLNAISVAEAEAECYLTAWAETTPRDDVRRTISTVALREGEHAKAFAKRICELGFEVRPRPDPSSEQKLAVAAAADIDDREKFERLGLVEERSPDQPDVFAGMMADTSIDIQTGALLGRYIAEERDSGRLLRSCYEQLCAEQHPPGRGESRTKKARLSALEERMSALEAKIDRLLDAQRRLNAPVERPQE